MKNLFEAAEVEELKKRIAQLSADSEKQWGKMNPAQMLAHCSATMGMAMGKISPPRILVGRLLGRLAKKSLIVNGTPMRRNSMTEKSCLVTDERDFMVERERLRESIDRFATGGPGVCTKHPHFFFGAADAAGMGDVDVPASGPPSSAVWSIVPERILFAA